MKRIPHCLTPPLAMDTDHEYSAARTRLAEVGFRDWDEGSQTFRVFGLAHAPPLRHGNSLQ